MLRSQVTVRWRRFALVIALAVLLTVLASRPGVLAVVLAAYALTTCLFLAIHAFFAACFGVRVREWVVGSGPNLATVRLAGSVVEIRVLPTGASVEHVGRGAVDYDLPERAETLTLSPDVDGASSGSFAEKSRLERAIMASSNLLALGFASVALLGVNGVQTTIADVAWGYAGVLPFLDPGVEDVVRSAAAWLKSCVDAGRWRVAVGGVCVVLAMHNALPFPPLTCGHILLELITPTGKQPSRTIMLLSLLVLLILTLIWLAIAYWIIYLAAYSGSIIPRR